jgi:hypothetical protein
VPVCCPSQNKKLTSFEKKKKVTASRDISKVEIFTAKKLWLHECATMAGHTGLTKKIKTKTSDWHSSSFFIFYFCVEFVFVLVIRITHLSLS